MKVLFSALHFANYRNYESVVRALAERGHRVHLTAEEPEAFGGQALVEQLAAEYQDVSWGWAPSVADEGWSSFAQKIRHAVEYVRFRAPEYADAPKLRIRSRERAPRIVRWLTSGIGSLPLGQRLILRVLTWIERRLPASVKLQSFLAEQGPDLLVVTALTVARSAQVHQLKAAQTLGIRTAAAILSWDHLSSKALLHIAPQRTLVWNDTQKQEATRLHNLPADRVVVTGAQCYDQWFDRRPTRTREQFCAALGLDPARRIILYVCSTMSPAPDPVEPVFVREWVRAVRASADLELTHASLLIRPHPERVKEWRGVSLDEYADVVVRGRTPIDSEAKADYFDSLFYSDVVVGLCTSAFLEAAIVGRPVLTLLLPAFRIHQEGMAHFRYLLTVGGGLLHTSRDLDSHLSQLGTAIRGRGARDERNQRFLSEFIRPAGLDVPSTPQFVAALEALAVEAAPAPDHLSTRPSPATTALQRLALSTRSGLGRWLMMDAIDSARAQSEHERSESREAIVAARTSYRNEKVRQAEQLARDKALEHRRKRWSRWWRGLSLRKQLARVKGSMKHVLGERLQ